MQNLVEIFVHLYQNPELQISWGALLRNLSSTWRTIKFNTLEVQWRHLRDFTFHLFWTISLSSLTINQSDYHRQMDSQTTSLLIRNVSHNLVLSFRQDYNIRSFEFQFGPALSLILNFYTYWHRIRTKIMKKSLTNPQPAKIGAKKKGRGGSGRYSPLPLHPTCSLSSQLSRRSAS